MTNSLAGSVPSVLVADDEDMVLKFVSLVLKRAGYRVLAAGDGAKALEVAHAHPERPALAVLDLVMPGMDGVELYDRLREIYPALPVLFISGYSEAEVGRRCAGRVDVLNLLKKPFTSTDLLARVRKTIDRSISIST